jgi:hypothetical protein
LIVLWTIMEKPERVPLQDWTKCLTAPCPWQCNYRDGSACSYQRGPWDNCHLQCKFLLPHSSYVGELANVLWPFSSYLDVQYFTTGSSESVSPFLPTIAQISRGPIFHYVRLIAFIIPGLWNSFNHIMLPGSLCTMLKINFRAFYACWDYFVFHYCYFTRSWKQIGILYWKWIPTSVKVLLVPITHECWDATVYIYSRKCGVMLHTRTWVHCKAIVPVWATVHH